MSAFLVKVTAANKKKIIVGSLLCELHTANS